jgi:hypothetical protein
VNARSPGGLRNAVRPLIEQDLVAIVDGAYRVTSPFFAQWLRAQP